MRKVAIWVLLAVAGGFAVDEFLGAVRRVNQASRELRETPREIALGEPRAVVDPGRATDAYETKLVNIADRYLRAHREEWKLQKYHAFVPTVTRSVTGAEVSYSVYQDNVQVVGLGITAEFDEHGALVKWVNNYRPVLQSELGGAGFLSLPQAVERIRDRYAVSSAALARARAILYADSVNAMPSLVYVVRATETGAEARSVRLLLRAADGQVLGRSTAAAE